MSDTVVKIDQLTNRLDIKRSDIVWPLLRVTKTRGDAKGEVYLCPQEISEDNLQDYIKWAGLDFVLQTLNAKERTLAQAIFGQAVLEDGEHVNTDKLEQFHTERSVRSETKGELMDLQADVNGQLQTIMLKLNDPTDPTDKLKLMAEGARLVKLAQDYQAAIERKSRERKSKAEKEEEGELVNA